MGELRAKLGESLKENRKARKERFQAGFGKYGLLIIGILVLCVITIKDPCPVDSFTVNDIQRTETKTATGWFVAGQMDEGHRFASSSYRINEEGICEIYLREYRNFGFIGGNQFVVYVKGNPDDVKEMWYVFPKEYADANEVRVKIMENGTPLLDNGRLILE